MPKAHSWRYVLEYFPRSNTYYISTNKQSERELKKSNFNGKTATDFAGFCVFCRVRPKSLMIERCKEKGVR